MECKFIDFSEISNKLWDQAVDEMEGHIHLASSNSINYYSAFEKISNNSFLVEFDKKILAVVPLAVNKNLKNFFYGFNYNYCPSPVFKKKLRPSIRRKVLKSIIDHIQNKNMNIKRLNLFTHPIYYSKKNFEINSKNQFEMIEFTKNYSVINTFMVDLKLEMDELMSNLSKYHKRNILRSSSKMTFNVYDNKDIKVTKKKFEEFKDLHFQSAGRKTRPDLTWDIMFENIIKGLAVLFSSQTKKKDISYLYCGILKDFAWGWSQVNNKNFEKEYMPRHFLEWEAIQYFKRKEFSFYELGECCKIKGKKFTKKELSISDFKEKYGSASYPKSLCQIKL